MTFPHSPDVFGFYEKMIQAMDNPHQWYGSRTYAQHGDDLAILNIFGCLRILKPSYLDIGAHHPFELSNTAILYQRGSRGINVEANPALIDAFHRMRPEDKNVCVAVGPHHGLAKLNRVNETSGINSLLPIEGHGAMLDAVDVSVLTIDEIVDIYADGCWPDMLTIDAEGMDLSILQSIDYSRGQPKVICAEATSAAGDIAADLRTLMSENGYFVHSWVGSNMLFVRSELRDWLY
jgi:FkbM family methyltransferase